VSDFWQETECSEDSFLIHEGLQILARIIAREIVTSQSPDLENNAPLETDITQKQ
jgi:hypothetical protein